MQARQAVRDIVIAAIVGALHVYPDLWFFRELGPRYTGVHFVATVDETTYLSRLSRVLAGDYRLGNAMIWEHRNDPFTYAPLPEYVQGTLGRLLGLSIVQVDIGATAVLSGVIFALFLLLLRELTGRHRLALVGALTLSLGHYLVAKNSPLLQARLYDPQFPHSLQFVRPVSPQFHYVVFVLALWLLYRVYVGRGGAGTRLAAGIVWGLAFYLNFFFWTFLAAGIVLWIVWSAGCREAARCRAGLVVLAIGLLVGAYYFVNSYFVIASPGFPEAALRAGFIYTRAPILPVAHLVWLVLLATWLWRHREVTAGRFLLIFLVAGFLCLNQQVLTGRTVQPFHWETQTNKVAMLLSFFVVLGATLDTLERRSGMRRGLLATGSAAAGTLVVTVLLAHAMLLQANYYAKNRDRVAGLQTIGPALAWLRASTPTDAVVLANPAVPLRSDLVTVYARRYTYLSEPFFNVSVISQAEVDDRHLLAMQVFGYGERELHQILNHHGGAALFGMHALPGYRQGRDGVIRRHLDLVADRYRRLTAGLEGLPPERVFRVDYLLVGRDERKAVRSDVLGVAREVYTDPHFQILEVGRRQSL